MYTFMVHAIHQAKVAFCKNEIPVGAVIIKNNEVISCDHNQVNCNMDVTAHAEILCIKSTAKKLKTTNLSNCDIYTTLEPCAMCAQAIAFSKIKRIYFAAYDKKFGAVENGVRLFHSGTYNHIPEIYGGINQQKSIELLQQFFAKIRKRHIKNSKFINKS